MADAESKQSRLLAEWAGLHASLIWAYAGPPPDYAREAWVSAPFYSAYYVYAGRLLVQDEHGTVEASAKEWLLPRQGRRWQQCSPGTRLLSLRFRVKWPTGEDLFADHPALSLAERSAPALKPAGEALHKFVLERWGERRVEMLAAEADLGAHLGLQSRLHVWLEAWAEVLVRAGARVRHCAQPDDRVRRILSFLDALPLAKGHVKEARLAEMANLSVSHLNRLFRQHTRMTPREYLGRRKLAAAVLAVEDTDQAFKKIAGDLGFSSPPHFTRWFRQHAGATPASFRQRSRSSPRGVFPDVLADGPRRPRGDRS